MNDILELLKDKKKVLKFLLDTIDKNEKSALGLRKIAGKSNKDYVLNKTLEVVTNQSLQIKSLSIILLIYSQSNSFDQDIAKMLIKMGKSEEALQQMLKNKMNGL